MNDRQTAVSVLPPQQERFAQLLASGKSQADSYREAYPKSKKWKPTAVHEKASHLMAIGKVRARVEELRKPVIEAVRQTLAQHLATLADIRDKAVAEKRFESAVKAEELRGRACGYYVERKEKGPPGAFSEDKEELVRRIKERMVRLGLAKVVPIADQEG